MTAHSGPGQGDPPLYEGVVLPANGDPWTPEQQRQVDQSHGQPPAGQPWGQPWGPESESAVASVTSGEPPASPLPPPPAAPPPMPPSPPAEPPVPQSQRHAEALPGSLPEPGAAGGGRHRGGRHSADAAPQAGQSSADLSHSTVTPVDPPPSAAAVPPPPQEPPASFGASAAQAPDAHGGQVLHGDAPAPPQQQPSAGEPFGAGGGATQMLTAQQQGGAAPGAESASDATQYIPPVADTRAQPGAYQPGQAASPMPDAEATQMLPPQTGGAPAVDPESTTQLRKPLPPEGAQTGQGRQQPQPPAGFESLFRSEPASGTGAASGGAGEPGANQSLPFFDQAVTRQRSGGVGGLGRANGPSGPATPAGAYGPGAGHGSTRPGPVEPQGRAARRNAERSTLSRIPPGLLIGVGVAVVAGVGMATGAWLTSGDEEEPKRGSNSSAAPAADKSAAPEPDPVEAQAKELDKLLADSNNSRATVIRSVENIKVCKKLGESARDLRSAAGQRNGLVTRLGQLKTDKLPDEAQLKSALTRAWKASASADDHYAAWADQTAGKKGCRKGKARPTGHTALGARASGEATTAKKQAAKLWNPTAKKYGLKERQVGEL